MTAAALWIGMAMWIGSQPPSKQALAELFEAAVMVAAFIIGIVCAVKGLR